MRFGRRARPGTVQPLANYAERSPRLVIRFAVVSALCLGCASAAILLFTRHLNQRAAEREAARHATFVARSELSQVVGAGDTKGEVVGARRAALDRSLRRLLGSQGTSQDGSDGIIPSLAISVANGDGVATYSTDHRLIGTRVVPAARLRDAKRDVTSSEIANTPLGETSDRRSHRALFAYVPFESEGGGSAVAVVALDDRAISAAASSAFYPIAGILELALVVLYVILVPLLARVSRRLRSQMERIQFLAYHDDLTGLGNRLSFRTDVAAKIAGRREEDQLAVLIVDVDRFKEINDTLGHQAGDSLLIELAQRLGGRLGKTVTLARLGGDELGLATLTDERGAEQLARTIADALRDDFLVEGVPVGVEASIGIAICPQDGNDVETLMARADMAMYEAKTRRSGSVRYEAGFDESQQIQIGLLAELRRALDEQEIALYFQPQIDLRTRTVAAVEALARWRHPTRGLIPASGFLPYAQKTGVNRALTTYVLEAALGQLAAWQRQGIEIRAAVNITMFDLLDPAFPADLAELLAKSSIPASQLELEITENEIMSDVAQVRATLEKLREQGIRLAIDDFGAGYSSLAYLRTLPVDTLKIDKSFILGLAQDPSNLAIVKAIISLGTTFGLTVVAEGTETEETAALLQHLGCQVGQGYLFGHAVPAEDVDLRLRSSARPARAIPA